MPDRDPILLKTKLTRPPIARSLIDRPKLFEILNSGISRPLTLVVASAGFGKTTLVSTWLEQLSHGQISDATTIPVTWLSLDEYDSDLNVFLRYLIAALRMIFPDACEETLAMLQARQDPSDELLFATFDNEIEDLGRNFILVLDDYHALQGMQVHNLIKQWSSHWPSPLHLVLISRINPPFPLASMRAKGLVTEIRTEDLRFSPGETAAYLQQTQFFQLSQPALDLMEARFEGWIAGLQLAALSLRSAVSQDDVLIGLSGDNANITGYLMDEVLIHQYPAIQSFLLKTSILDRLSPGLCAAVMGESDTTWNARACLDWIERSELFITPLDNRREWYRYHQLFQELLQQRLSVEATPDEIGRLHLQASTWYEEHGLIDEALQHSLVAGDLSLAVRQMVAGLCEVTNREDRPTLERWLRLLPGGVIENDAGLLMVKAWALQFMWRLDLQAQVLQQAGALLDAGNGREYDRGEEQVLRGQILGLMAQHAYLSNQNDQAIDFARQALALLPPPWKFVRGGAMLFLGMAMQAIGQAQQAEKLLLDEFASQDDKTDVYSLALLRGLCFVYLNSGSLVRCEQTARLLQQGSVSRKIAIMKNWSDWYLGLVHYQWNELEAAAGYFSQIMENRYTAQVTTMRDAVAGIALIHQLRGDPKQAWQMVESISHYDLELYGIEDVRTRSLRARLLLMEGDQESAGRWADSFTAQPPDAPLLWLAEPQIMRVRALLARGNQADLQSAQRVLDALEDITDRTYNIRFKIQLLAFRAILLDAQGDTGAAEALLKQALELGRPGRFNRVFLDLGKPIQAILNRLVSQYPDMQIIPAILAAFPEVARIPERNGEQPQISRLSRQANASLVDPLTPRELEVLALLRGPKNIKEIAQELFISYATAKRHTINIYAKLGVNQRWDAVNRAEELGILPPR